jgi:hypothetical protein
MADRTVRSIVAIVTLQAPVEPLVWHDVWDLEKHVTCRHCERPVCLVPGCAMHTSQGIEVARLAYCSHAEYLARCRRIARQWRKQWGYALAYGAPVGILSIDAPMPDSAIEKFRREWEATKPQDLTAALGAVVESIRGEGETFDARGSELRVPKVDAVYAPLELRMAAQQVEWLREACRPGSGVMLRRRYGKRIVYG